MFKTYIKVITRFLLRNKVFTFINIFGLAISLTASIFILQHVFYELSYDKHLKESDRIFRLKQSRYDKGKLSTVWANGCGSVGIALKSNYPEVEDYVRLYGSRDILVRFEEKAFKESKLFYSTPSFFSIFPYKILIGNTDSLLTTPYKIVITEKIANKYFGNDNPIGKTLKINTKTEFVVEAVCENPPNNTHFKFDFLISWATWEIFYEHDINDENTWFWDGFYNYVKLHPKTNLNELEKKIPALVEEKWGETMKQYNTSSVFEFQPIKSIHLYSDYMGEFEKNGNGKSTYFLMFIAIFLIIIAWINYINLSTAQSIERAKEVGLKKVIGANKGNLIRQFLFESIIINFIAIIFSILLIITFIPQFSALTGKSVNFTFLLKSEVTYIAIAIYIVCTILVGLFPAIALSSFKPIKVLKGSLKNSTQGVTFRKVLVVFQFVVSLILITGTLIIFQQLSFMKNQDKNFDSNNILTLDGPIATDSTYSNKYSVLKNEILQQASVESFSSSSCVPGEEPSWNAGGVRLEDANENESLQYRIIAVDYDYLNVYKMELAAGRFFSNEYETDETTILLNETGMRLIGFNHPDSIINKKIFFWGKIYNVIGVIKDYNHESLKENVSPYIFRLIPNTRNYYSIRYNQAANKTHLINDIEKIWKKNFPAIPFEYFYLEDYYNEQYNDETIFGRIFFIFSILAILIACLGLFGLASYSSHQRTKEIGIRKVMGASSLLILNLFVRENLKLTILSIIIGLPICYYILDNWLLNFAQHITISWWLLTIPSFLLILISLVTISSNSLKSANTNPIDSLKYE
jgi:putative ABC transport system permease protein